MTDDDDIQEYSTSRDINNIRNQVLEEVAQKFDAMRTAFGDTADSFARYVRDMKHERFR